MTGYSSRWALGFALALAVTAAACGDGTFGTTTTGAATTTSAATTTVATTTSAGTTTTATTTTTAATTTTSAFAGDTGPEASPIRGVPSGLLTDVRYAQREGFTRIVFDFAGTDGFPAYDIRYQAGPFRNMADEVVPVAGTAFLRVQLQPASRVDLSVDPYVLTYTGPERIDPGTVSVEEVVFVEDFEANMVWVIGITGEKPFTVGTLTNPPRIYIDIAD